MARGILSEVFDTRNDREKIRGQTGDDLGNITVDASRPLHPKNVAVEKNLHERLHASQQVVKNISVSPRKGTRPASTGQRGCILRALTGRLLTCGYVFNAGNAYKPGPFLKNNTVPKEPS